MFSKYASTLTALKCYSTFILIITYQLLTAQIAETWSLDINGSGDYSDKFSCVIQDASGNYLAAGSTVKKSSNRDFLVVKYSNAGDTLWTFQLDGGFGGPDAVTSIKADNSGNVYFTGFAKGYYTGYDLFVGKLNSQGDSVWTRKYNYLGANDDDIPVSIALDNSGNIIVSGYSDSDPSSLVSNDDILLLKYNNSGSLLWFQRYNGANNGIDRAANAVVNSSGEIYVGGRADNGDDDYILLKYSSAGSQLWVRNYDTGNNDRGLALTIDASGNCYFAGRAGNGVDQDLLTLKYNSTGTLVYTAVYDYLGDDRATAIAVDATGNVYVTGQSDGDAGANKIFDFVTIKYNASGAQQWATRYSAPSSGDDIPLGIAFTSSGEVWVTGISDVDASTNVQNDWVTIKYSASGAQQAINIEGTASLADEGAACIVDAAGKAVVVGFKSLTNNQPNATIIRITTAGVKEFERNFDGQGDNQDQVNALCFSSDGSLLAAGFSYEKDLDANMCISKVSTSGALVWKKTLSGNSSTGSSDNATAILCDASGNIYVTGYTKNSNAGSDFMTVKMTQAGDTVWSRKYSFQSGASDRSVAIALDPQNNIVVTGYSDSDPSILTNYDFVTIKYSPTGSQLWAVRYNSSYNADDRPVSMVVAPSGNIYIAGRSFNGVDDDLLLVKYNSNGISQWIHTWSGGVGDDRNTALVVDAAENCYISGRTFNGSDLDALIVKVNGTGQTAWFRTINGGGISDDRFNDLSLDASGNVYAVGQTDTDPLASIELDLLIGSWSADGTSQWQQTFAAPNAFNEHANCILVKPNGVLLVGGAASNNQGNNAPLTLRFNSSGSLLWYGLPGFSSALGAEVNDILYSNNSVFTGGFVVRSGQMSNLHFQKYNDTITGISALAKNQFSYWPNPVSNKLHFKFQDDINELSTVSVLDALGKVVDIKQVLVVAGRGELDFTTIQPGYYFMTISTKKGTQVCPIIVQ